MSKVRVGLIGCGGFARYRAGNLPQIAEIEVVAMADPAADMLDAMVRQHGYLAHAKRFSDYRDMLRDMHLDAVLIATPHTQHAQQIVDCMDAGSHVLCEKPLVSSLEDAARVIKARDKSGKVGMVSYQRHFQPEFRWIREKMLAGETGAVQFVQAMLCQNWKRGTAGTWRQDPALSGGGQLGDSGSHVVDVLMWATGLEPQSVCAFEDKRGTPVDINTSLAVKFSNGALGSIAIIGDAHHWQDEISIWCEHMSFFVRDGELKIATDGGNRFKAESLSGGSNPDRHFFDCVLGRAECESPFECGVQVIRLTQAAWDSAATGGKPVHVAPI